MNQYTVTTDRSATFIYADGPEEAAKQFAQRLPKKLTAQLEYISQYGEWLYYFKAGRTAFTVQHTHEGEWRHADRKHPRSRQPRNGPPHR